MQKKDHDILVNVLQEKLETARKILVVYFKQGYHHKDDKILASWNVLMIMAYEKAARVYKIYNYLQTAKQATKFIEEHLIVRYRNRGVKQKHFIDGYAFLT